jgi:heme-degrading monooxygenase HmoA
MWVRMNKFQGPPNQSDQEIEQMLQPVQEKILPALRQQSGYKGVMNILDRSSGNGITLTFWESEEAMHASEEWANQARQQGAEDTGTEITGVERFEVFISEPPQD